MITVSPSRPKVDAISWAERDSSFHHAFADGFGIAQITISHALKCYSHAGSRVMIESPEPTLKRASSPFVVVFQ